MKKLMFAACMLLALATATAEYNASQWDYRNTPLNYENSTLNYDNSTLKWENSPLNYDNSSWNPDRNNVYNEDGSSMGYKVIKEDGGANYFNNSGKRIGYEPVPDFDE